MSVFVRIALLESPVGANEVAAIKNAKNLYQSCLNMSSIEDRQEGPLLVLIREFGGWPVLDPKWNASSFRMESLLSRLKLLNLGVLINHWVSSDDKKSDSNIIQMDQGQLGMPSRDYYLRERNDKTLLTYQNFAINVAKALGADPYSVEEEIIAMIDFEIQLANITVPEEKRRDAQAIYHLFTLKELYTNLSTEIDWKYYLQQIFSTVNITLDDDESIIVYTPEYMKDLAILLRSTPNRTLANYLIWHMVLNRVNNLSQKFLDIRRDFNKVMLGTEQERARWRVCVNYVNENMGMAVGRMYVAEYFDEDAKTSAVKMIQHIRGAFRELLKQVPWMDKTTKNVAQEKADSIREKIGYPDYINNDTALNRDYDGINCDPKRYFENVLNILTVSVKNNIKQLRQKVDRDRWSTTPAVINAFYSATRNQIMFPAGILSPPFYHENNPMSLNFGGIGMVIGHEITHGFDDKGRQFDKIGNLVEWWSAADIEQFKEKAQCIIDQYSNYTMPEIGISINGRQTQGENIADNGGLKQAYQAYQRWVEKNGPEVSLPGISLNHDQLFFLNFAQIWCGTSRPESLIQAVRASKHCPGNIRVIGSLSNSADFARAYNCRPGSRMNPVKKCSVW